MEVLPKFGQKKGAIRHFSLRKIYSNWLLFCLQFGKLAVFHIVGFVSVPIGIPNIYHPITISIRSTANKRTDGNICFNVPNTVIFTLSFLLYFSRNASITIKYINSGVRPLPILSAILNTNCVKSGVMLAFMKSGTITGDAIVHFVVRSGINIDINMIPIMVININGIPVNSRLPINDVMRLATTSPRLV